VRGEPNPSQNLTTYLSYIAIGLEHPAISSSPHLWQADIETVHRLIEDEFYEVEEFEGREDFLRKAGAYTLWFNCVRKNSYKNNQSPWEIIHSRDPDYLKRNC